jgi:Carbohydrate-selective porin, OprB family/S-layer homology domain
MKNIFVLGGALALASIATASLAAEPLTTVATTQDRSESSPFSTFQVIPDEQQEQAQVTSVSQLSDVQPTDWAFQALQSLVERYGCIAGYPDGTFKGNRAATRFELAAALNACLDQISDRFATKEDLATVKALQEEFKTELATLKGRVDGLEARTKTLEAQQFSTTTKLVGEAIFYGTQYGNTNNPVPVGSAQGSSGKIGDNFTFNYRATLNLLTSFSGKDLLITSLGQGSFGNRALVDTDPNSPFFGTQTSFSGLLGAEIQQANAAGDNSFGLFYLGYRFPVLKDKGTVYITATGGELSDFVDTLNPYFDSAGQGALSSFGMRNPLYRQIVSNVSGSSFSGTGAGINYKFNDQFSLGVGYLAPTLSAATPTVTNVAAGFPGDGAGLFGGDYAAIAQLTYKPMPTLGFGLAYTRSFRAINAAGIKFGGGAGTLLANNPFGFEATSSNSVGASFSWEASKRFALSGWAAASFANQESNGNGNATILNFALAAAFPDLFIPGNMGGIIVGVEPNVISSNIAGNTDRDLPIHLEALYRFKVNDNISITPGVVAILNAEGNSGNDPVILGTIRTTFTF